MSGKPSVRQERHYDDRMGFHYHSTTPAIFGPSTQVDRQVLEVKIMCDPKDTGLADRIQEAAKAIIKGNGGRTT